MSTEKHLWGFLPGDEILVGSTYYEYLKSDDKGNLEFLTGSGKSQILWFDIEQKVFIFGWTRNYKMACLFVRRREPKKFGDVRRRYQKLVIHVDMKMRPYRWVSAQQKIKQNKKTARQRRNAQAKRIVASPALPIKQLEKPGVLDVLLEKNRAFRVDVRAYCVHEQILVAVEEILRAKNMAKETLAENMGETTAYVNRMFVRDERFTLLEISNIADALGCKIELSISNK